MIEIADLAERDHVLRRSVSLVDSLVEHKMKLMQLWQMNSSSDGKQPHGNRTLITVAIVFVCYMNLAEIMDVSCLRLSLPRPYPLAQLFHMFSLWSDYTEWNSGYEA